MQLIEDAHPRYIGYANDIAGAARHLLGLVGATGPQPAEPGDSADIIELAARARAMAILRATDKHLNFPQLDGPAHLVRGAPGHILQILVNLVGNAVNYTPAGGRIEMRCHRAGGLVHFEVIDSGPGVPDDAHELVFRAFERIAQSEGVGLGLAISRDLARRMDGDLAIIPSRAGALFRLTLPAA